LSAVSTEEVAEPVVSNETSKIESSYIGALATERSTMMPACASNAKKHAKSPPTIVFRRREALLAPEMKIDLHMTRPDTKDANSSH
jgi:hypothetical protein